MDKIQPLTTFDIRSDISLCKPHFNPLYTALDNGVLNRKLQSVSGRTCVLVGTVGVRGDAIGRVGARRHNSDARHSAGAVLQLHHDGPGGAVETTRVQTQV